MPYHRNARMDVLDWHSLRNACDPMSDIDNPETLEESLDQAILGTLGAGGLIFLLGFWAWVAWPIIVPFYLLCFVLVVAQDLLHKMSGLSNGEKKFLEDFIETVALVSVGVFILNVVQILLWFGKQSADYSAIFAWKLRISALHHAVSEVLSTPLLFFMLFGLSVLKFFVKNVKILARYLKIRKILGRFSIVLVTLTGFSFSHQVYVHYIESEWISKQGAVLREIDVNIEDVRRQLIAIQFIKTSLSTIPASEITRIIEQVSAINKKTLYHFELAEKVADKNVVEIKNFRTSMWSSVFSSLRASDRSEMHSRHLELQRPTYSSMHKYVAGQKRLLVEIADSRDEAVKELVGSVIGDALKGDGLEMAQLFFDVIAKSVAARIVDIVLPETVNSIGSAKNWLNERLGKEQQELLASELFRWGWWRRSTNIPSTEIDIVERAVENENREIAREHERRAEAHNSLMNSVRHPRTTIRRGR